MFSSDKYPTALRFDASECVGRAYELWPNLVASVSDHDEHSHIHDLSLINGDAKGGLVIPS
jgi:hypothetical protein